MSTRVVDRVDEWSERPFTDGHRTLHKFADEEFSGVVRAGGAELYMTKGTVVGVRHGSIEEFTESGTAYEAPSPALPLLAEMQEANDDVRAEYYSEKTSIAEVDSTLSDGGFTGFVELSDNVLSGDYYQVYHAGQSMSVGFIGESSRLIHGDEAFETANDEVGIYQVRPAELSVIELPDVEPVHDESADAGAETEQTDDEDEVTETAAVEGATTNEEATATKETDETDATSETDQKQDDEETTDEPTTGDRSREANSNQQHDDTAAAEQLQTEADTESGRTEKEDESAQTEVAANNTANSTVQGAQVASQSQPTAGDSESVERSTDQRGASRQQKEQSAESLHGTSQRSSAQSGRSTGTADADVDLETQAIPSLDPSKTEEPENSGTSSPADSFVDTQEQQSSGTGTTHEKQSVQSAQPVGSPQATQTVEPTQTTQSETTQTREQPENTPDKSQQKTTDEPSVDTERVSELEAEIEERDEEIDRLESALDQKTTEYEDVKSQLESARTERDELAAEVEELEADLERLETELGAATDAERRMTAGEALSGTDIFPRYASKGDATLEKAHNGSNRREDVLGNLRLEQNTQFDADAVSVGGEVYDTFLESTLEYRFVNWVVGNLLFEIRETGHEKPLKDLYDSLPVIDWADLKGTVDVVYSEDGQETRSQESFDIVLRNRMGEPLIVANLNDARKGATESMMENLVRSAKRVGQSSDAFAGAFLVTRSFFEPPALETADEATKSGLLSRSKRKSFVNISRKNGYHLCLVEARNENFTLLVPEL
ncbi:hypothetical protein ACFQJ7_00220 [Halovenus rubra]|uniref:DUF7527 domain-containing protein n=2 Tax=Halovenus rubra TaxID=869890 RepID=A0ABD5WZV2_9EURY|nr:hypothetical protein [Halovenus rubra]